MGANQSHTHGGVGSEREWHRERLGVQAHRPPRLHVTDQLDGGKKSRAKPGPPQRPKVTHVTHNAVSLTWSPPRHPQGQPVLAYTVEVSSTSDRHNWKTLTKACQGIRYEARYLESSTEYVFRVKAENVFGVGKASVPSEPALTKEYDTDVMVGFSEQAQLQEAQHYPQKQQQQTAHSQQQPNLPVEEKSMINGANIGSDEGEKNSKPIGGSASLQRRHSFSMHLDSRVSSILNHSTTTLNKSFPVTTTTANSTLQRSSRGGSERGQTLTRSNFSRTSLPSNRKVSLPILLPGTGTNSVNRLRESRNSLRSSTSDGHISLASARDQTRTRLRESRSSLGSSVSDITSSLAPSDDAGRKRDSRGSLRSDGSNSDVTPAQSRDGCGSSTDDNSRDEGMCDCSPGTGEVITTPTNNNNVIKSWDLDILETLGLNKDGFSKSGKSDEFDESDDFDDVAQLKHNLKNLELTEEKLKFHNLNNRLRTSDSSFSKSDAQKGYYESLENPWERDTSIDGVSQRIMTAPFCDDIKMALCAKSVAEDYPGFSANQNLEKEQEGGDFRTLQRVLQSNSLIVRASRTSASDIVGVVMEEDGPAHLMRRGPLTTIMDEEEEDPVRVTTL